MAARAPLVIVSGLPAQLPSGDTLSGVLTEVEIDFGLPAVREKRFTITDASVAAGAKIVAVQSGNAGTGRAPDENEMDQLVFSARSSSSGSFLLFARCTTGRVTGKYKLHYMIG